MTFTISGTEEGPIAFALEVKVDVDAPKGTVKELDLFDEKNKDIFEWGDFHKMVPNKKEDMKLSVVGDFRLEWTSDNWSLEADVRLGRLSLYAKEGQNIELSKVNFYIHFKDKKLLTLRGGAELAIRKHADATKTAATLQARFEYLLELKSDAMNVTNLLYDKDGNDLTQEVAKAVSSKQLGLFKRDTFKHVGRRKPLKPKLEKIEARTAQNVLTISLAALKTPQNG